MQVNIPQVPPPPVAASAAIKETVSERAKSPDLLAAREQTSLAKRIQSTPELRIARGGDSLEISQAGRALLEASLKQRNGPDKTADADRQEALKGDKPAGPPPPGEVPNLLVARK